MILLDTHIFVWWFQEPDKITQAQRVELQKVAPDNPAHLCTISLWEIAMLHGKGRIRLGDVPLKQFLEDTTAPPLVKLQPVTPAIAAAIADLPATFHGDPADRIIVATAQVLGAMLITVDGPITESKLVSVCR
jgi:PIN domain nuclease of toxin-antitoxin system